MCTPPVLLLQQYAVSTIGLIAIISLHHFWFDIRYRSHHSLVQPPSCCLDSCRMSWWPWIHAFNTGNSSCQLTSLSHSYCFSTHFTTYALSQRKANAYQLNMRTVHWKSKTILLQACTCERGAYAGHTSTLKVVGMVLFYVQKEFSKTGSTK